jgi:hypothetical protein
MVSPGPPHEVLTEPTLSAISDHQEPEGRAAAGDGHEGLDEH